jgi:hypothetical protein
VTFAFFGMGSPVTLPDLNPATWTYGPGVDEIEAANAVIAAARTYAEFTHSNLTGARYKARQEARDALLDALEAFDDAQLPATMEIGA